MIRTPLVLDASIILNMLSVNSLETLLAVEREFCTTDFVLNSIKKTICKGTFAKLEKSQKLKIYSIDKDVEKFFEDGIEIRKFVAFHEDIELLNKLKGTIGKIGGLAISSSFNDDIEIEKKLLDISTESCFFRIPFNMDSSLSE